MHLQDWETRLRPYLSQVKFLAEIPLSQAEHTDLEDALRAFVQRHGRTEAAHQLQHNYPASFAAYLALQVAPLPPAKQLDLCLLYFAAAKIATIWRNA
jgi:hypothetical protein